MALVPGVVRPGGVAPEGLARSWGLAGGMGA